jgi:hypothetical protein
MSVPDISDGPGEEMVTRILKVEDSVPAVRVRGSPVHHSFLKQTGFIKLFCLFYSPKKFYKCVVCLSDLSVFIQQVREVGMVCLTCLYVYSRSGNWATLYLTCLYVYSRTGKWVIVSLTCPYESRKSGKWAMVCLTSIQQVREDVDLSVLYVPSRSGNRGMVRLTCLRSSRRSGKQEV